MMYLPLVVPDPVAPVPDLVVVRVLDRHLSHDGGQGDQNASHNFPSLFEKKKKIIFLNTLLVTQRGNFGQADLTFFVKKLLYSFLP